MRRLMRASDPPACLQPPEAPMSAPKPLLRLVSVLAGALLATASVGLAFGADAEAERRQHACSTRDRGTGRNALAGSAHAATAVYRRSPRRCRSAAAPLRLPGAAQTDRARRNSDRLEGHQPSGVIGRAASRPGCCGWCQGLIPRDHQEGRLRHPRGRRRRRQAHADLSGAEQL